MSEASIPDATTSTGSRSFLDRVIGVLRLDSSAYEEIAAGSGAMGQAAAVVVASAVIRALTAQGGPFGTQGILFLVQISALWPALSLLIYAIGRWFGFEATPARVARVIGFAFAPFLLVVLSLVPVQAVQIAVAFLSTALLIATLVVGTRHALQAAIGWAGFVCAVVALVMIFVSMVYGYLAA